MGDFQGHPFRGNQWTEGTTSASTAGASSIRGGEDGGSFLNKRIDDVDQAHAIARVTEREQLYDSLRKDHYNLDSATVTRVAKLREQQVAELKARGVEVQSIFDDRGHSDRVGDVQMLLRVQNALDNMPAGSQEALAKMGMVIEHRFNDPANANDTVTYGNPPVTMLRGGSAGLDNTGRAHVLLIAYEGSAVGYSKDTKIESIVAPSANTIDHEMGHISQEIAARISKDHLAVPSESERDVLSDQRSIFGEMANEFSVTARAYEAKAQQATDAGLVGQYLRDAAQYKRDAEDMMQRVSDLYPAQEALKVQDAALAQFRTGFRETFEELEKAVHEEGGVTDYAERWRTDPKLGENGDLAKLLKATGTEPVHRGVNESLAEIEGFYAKAVRLGAVKNPSEFAKILASGGSTNLRSGLRDNLRKNQGERAAFPKLAKAWGDWRKLLAQGDRTAPKARLSKENRETIKRTTEGVSYKDWIRRRQDLSDRLRREREGLK